jgi:hypothetical protein
MRTGCAKLSRHYEVAKSMDYMLKRRAAVARFLDDGGIRLSNNAAGLALRGIADLLPWNWKPQAIAAAAA